MTSLFQSFPDSRDKLKCLEKGSLTAQAEVFAVFFTVYQGRDEKVRKQECLMLAKAFQLAKQMPRFFPYPPKA